MLIVSTPATPATAPVTPTMPATDANTLIWFPLDDASGTTSLANQGTGTPFTLTETGDTRFGTPIASGDACMVVSNGLFEGTGSALTYQPATTAMTVSCWFECPNPNAVATSSTIWCKPNGGGGDATFGIVLDTSGATRVITVAGKVATTGFVTSAIGYASPGKTYFVAVTFDGSNMRAYINGILATTTAAVGAMSWDTAESFTIGVLGTADTYIASDCRCENVVRSAAEIKAAYNTGAFGR